jgi:L-erythro-3,5-diaminohexanoate dehydrogenase
MGERVLEIVESRGKMHNPETDSGGILLGTVAAAGERFSDPPAAGARIATLGSLTLTPLRLERVVRVDPDSPEVEVEGVAYVFDRAAWAELPTDIPEDAALAIYDVCAAVSQMRPLLDAGDTVCVLGAGQAGTLAMAAGRDAGAGTVVAVDISDEAVERATRLGLCDIGVTANLCDPLGALEAVRAAGAPPADLTVVVVNAAGCEPTALLLTADEGTVLFFSMATSFAAAALAADGIGSSVRMLVGSGYSVDRGEYALDLVRRSPALREALELGDAVEEPA